MTLSDIAARRVLQQQLAGTKINSAEALVEYMGAIQSQDYAMSKWAIGARLPGLTDTAAEQAINEGRIIRTHILRPTWHLVAANDLRWMLGLTAPHIRSDMTGPLRRQGIDEALVRRVNTLLARVLKGKQLTREELVTALSASRIKVNGLQAQLLMMRAELDEIVCNGARRGKQFTYALLDERLPAEKPLSRDEALAKLAMRYFTSRGPASLQDFAWWSGLPAADAKTALAACRAALCSEKAEGREYWFAGSGFESSGKDEVVRLLPAFDEFTISYRDRSASLDPRFGSQLFPGKGQTQQTQP